MKTITESQPLIYGLLIAQAERRRLRHQRTAQRLRLVIPALYVLLGLAIVFDAGIVPWDLRFWLIFSPFFLFGESVLSAMARGHKSAMPVAEERKTAPVNTTPAVTGAKSVDVQKRRKLAIRSRTRTASPALLLNAFQPRSRELSHPLPQLQECTRMGTATRFAESTPVLARSR